jgi:phytanoyl-CoA hydroxylase
VTATLEREGWLLVPKLVAGGTLEALNRATAALERTASAFVRDTVVGGVGFEVQSATGRRGEPAVAPGLLRKISFPSKGARAFAELRRDPSLLAVLHKHGLREPSCQRDQVNLKPPRVGTGFPFHQDARFLVGSTQGRIERYGGLNLVIALTVADAENGGFVVLGRTHTSGLKDIGYDTGGCNDGLFDETYRQLVPLEPGDAVLFHPHLAHGSGPNQSNRPRHLATLWFVGGAGAAQ